MAQAERPLPNLDAVLNRRDQADGERHRTELALEFCPRWRRGRRRELAIELARLEGFSEGVRMCLRAAEGKPPPPTDPGKGSC